MIHFPLDGKQEPALTRIHKIEGQCAFSLPLFNEITIHTHSPKPQSEIPPLPQNHHAQRRMALLWDTVLASKGYGEVAFTEHKPPSTCKRWGIPAPRSQWSPDGVGGASVRAVECAACHA